MAKKGRKTKLTKPVVAKILASIRKGETEKYSCAKAGVSYERFRVWRNSDPKNNEQVEDALEEWVNVHLANIDRLAKNNIGGSIWRLKTRFPERFADPNVLIQLNQMAAAANQQANMSLWLQSPSGQPAALPGQAFPELEFTCTGLDDVPEPPQQHIAELPPPFAPGQEPDLSHMPPKLRAHEMRKHTATTPSQPAMEIEAEAEVVDMSGNPKLRLPDNQLTEIEKLQRYGSGNRFEPGSRLTAAKPTPLSAPGFNANGERPMIDWRD